MDEGGKQISWPQHPVTLDWLLQKWLDYTSQRVKFDQKDTSQELELDTISCGTFFNVNILAVSI